MARRFDLYEATNEMVQDINGKWVKYEDFKELQDELQRIMSALIELAECGK